MGIARLLAGAGALHVLALVPAATEAASLGESGPIALDSTAGHHGLADVACPSVSQCTAVDHLGRVLTFNPATLGTPAGSGIATGGPASVSGTRARVVVKCAGSAGSTCAVRLTLSLTETFTGHQLASVSDARARTRRETRRRVIVGRIAVVLAGGRSAQGHPLDIAATRLLSSHKRLAVTLVVTQKVGATRKLRLRRRPAFGPAA